MEYVLKHKTQKHYITYRRPDAKLNPSARGKVLVAERRAEAFVFGTLKEAMAEKKRLTKAAKNFEPVDARKTQGNDPAKTGGSFAANRTGGADNPINGANNVNSAGAVNAAGPVNEAGSKKAEGTAAAAAQASKAKRKAVSKAKRNAVYAKTEGHCYMCGAFVGFDEFEVEHRIPVSCGGTNNLSNLFCACHVCNVMKNALPLSDVLIQAKRIADFQESGGREPRGAGRMPGADFQRKMTGT